MSNLSVVDLAHISQSVYLGQSGSIPAGYTQLSTETLASGMTGTTFQAPDESLVVAFTGTDSNAENNSGQLAADRQILAKTSTAPQALQDAANYLRQVTIDNPECPFGNKLRDMSRLWFKRRLDGVFADVDE